MKRMFYEFKQDDAFRFARHVNATTYQKGDELIFKECCYCHGRGKGNQKTFSINLITGQFKCLRASCGAHGNMITLSRDFDFSLGEQVDAYYRRPHKRYRTFTKPKEPIVPKPKAIEYLNSRGISEETAKRYQVTVMPDRENILCFTFYDEDGKPTFIKYRKTDYVKGRDKAKEWCEPNCKPILYGMEQCKLDNPQLTLTEGQCDTLALSEAGIENALSVPTGAKGFTWLPHCWNFLNQFERIVIFGDFENGKISLLDELKDRLELTVLHVKEEAYKGCKDANELLVKHGKEAVREAVETAIPIPVKRVIEMADVENINIYDVEKLPTGFDKLDRLLYGGLPFGGVTIISGIRGEGKSILASQIATRALEHNYTVMMYSGELTNASLKAWMHYQIAGPNHIQEGTNRWGDPIYTVSKTNNHVISEWYRGRMLLYDSDSDEIGDDEKESLVKTVREVIMRNGAKVIIIDNMMTAIDLEPTKGDDKYERQSKFVKKLGRLGRTYGVLIILVAHKRKTGSFIETDENDSVSGSADITNLAQITLTYRKGKDIDESQRLLSVNKNRLFGKICPQGWVMDYDNKSRRIYGQGDGLGYEIGWDKEGEETFDLIGKLGEGAEELLWMEDL